ncbi:MAG: asparagine synthase (glutamine-hydrolyzing) [Bacteroidetes bacterium]|nr:asparagine synthase (glutamine-hydrolyzing) [Bacteroidota bacterium]MBV6462013.1 Asparagine synthetase [glutamine-hydrolyzing] 1 [Flavobacteriales bacterium]WKZ76592.1 MAG: asparagine synthase (glutamine-hydrolyzing) [Vicingaceae bacterium]MCL4815587.1 asparagine synthase (glutamine-hydrolyzing) [Flavobacteriales bacterium]NOG94275.1 asparagine synthase (glutamine-hydrolyzing) [Bacteroidota bacterium]
MCGIAGVYSTTPLNSSVFERGEQVLNSMQHRGPNHKAYFKDTHTILCHTRLAIIDTNESANQPFSDASGRYLIVFNGEIFNFRELRNSLTDIGITFSTQSDTEVLLNLYISEGSNCLSKLNGFFSFCIYDTQHNSLFAATDRYGVKPFYYTFQNNHFVFSSELKALEIFNPQNEIDKLSLRTYLHLNYIPQPYSIYENVFKLEPGKYLCIENSTLIKNTYYSLKKQNKKTPPTPFNEAKQKVKELLEDAVKIRLVSDVPLGCFLSGGIDSSIITALAAKNTSKLKTFSVEFKNQPFFNETEYALAVSKMHQTEHTVISVDNDKVSEAFQKVLDNLSEPFADSSAIAVYVLCHEVKKHVTVALSGDGADELFAGYLKHQAEYKIQNLHLAEKFSTLLLPFLKLLPKSRNNSFTNKIRQATKLAQSIHLTTQDRYWQWAGNNYPVEKLLSPSYFTPKQEEVFVKNRKNNYLPHLNHAGFNEILLADQQMVLPGDMLTKVDRMSMANSVEVRTPFLDYRLVDFVNSLPAHYKLNRHQRKIILTETFKEILPPAVYLRSKKGFEIPLHFWLTHILKEKVQNEWLNTKEIENENIFNVPEIKKIKQKLFSFNPENTPAIAWAIIVFRYWHKKNYSNA